MSDSAPPIAVIVVNYNAEAFIDEFCASLAEVRCPPWRLIAIDSGSDDGSFAAIERAFPDATFVRCDENVGFAAGANIGVLCAMDAGCQYALFLNNDVKLTPDFLERLVAAADPHTSVVPKILYRDEAHPEAKLISTHAGGFDWTLGLFRNTYAGQPDGPATQRLRENLDTASFCCALVPLAAFHDSGMLDERFFMYYEETDFIKRAQAKGYRVRYEPSALVYHRESGASGGGWMTPFKQYYATRNRPYLVRKHAASRAKYAWFTAYFLSTRVITGARLAARRDWRTLRAMLRGTRDYYQSRMGRTYQVRDL